MCIGGPCCYGLEDYVDEAFILSNVVPNIHKRFNEETALIFGTALLYSVFCLDDATNNVPSSISSRVCAAYTSAGLDITKPPVRQVSLVCTRHEG